MAKKTKKVTAKPKKKSSKAKSEDRSWMYLLIFGIVIVVVAFILVFYTSTRDGDGDKVGGDRDEHGCLIPAGYTWCEEKQKCLREWEEPCVESGERRSSFEIEARGTAEQYVKTMPEYKENNGRDLRLVNIVDVGCSGCWEVEVSFIADSDVEGVEYDLMTVFVRLENWVAKNSSIVKRSILMGK